MWLSLITRTYFPFNVVTISVTTRLKYLNKTLSPIVSSDTYLIYDYYFKGIYTSFMYKSAHIKAPFYLRTLIITFIVYIRYRHFKSIKCIAICQGGESKAVLYIKSRLLAFLVALLSLLYNFPINKYSSYTTTFILDPLKRIRLIADLH